MAAAATAETSHAPTRLSSAVSTLLGLAGCFGPKPTTNACAGRATTNKNTTIKIMLSVASRGHSIGITMPAKAPASAAVIGVGMSVTLPRRLALRTSSLRGTFVLVAGAKSAMLQPEKPDVRRERPQQGKADAPQNTGQMWRDSLDAKGPVRRHCRLLAIAGFETHDFVVCLNGGQRQEKESFFSFRINDLGGVLHGFQVRRLARWRRLAARLVGPQ